MRLSVNDLPRCDALILDDPGIREDMEYPSILEPMEADPGVEPNVNDAELL